MRENALRQLQASRPQKCRPVDGMEAHDLLADQVHVRRPTILPCHGALVGAQRVEPNVKHMLFFAGNGNAPFNGGAADGEVL